MNGQDKKDLNVILERMIQADKDREQIYFTDVGKIWLYYPKKLISQITLR
jgi:hypothetical protein